MTVSIVPLLDLPPDAAKQPRAAIDAIFWETTTSPPTTATERHAFHDLWLGQYLRIDPALVFVAIDEHSAVGGYLVGTFANLATSPRFAALPYTQAFATAVTRFPAHLHVNLTTSWRGRGVGGLLVDAFADRVAAAGLPGFHVITGAAARNVPFYTRANFQEIARTTNARGNTVLFLGRAVA